VTAAVATVRPLRLVVVATAALVVGAIVLRVANPYALPGPSISALVPLLWAVGALAVLLLTQAWAPTFAWLAAIIGSSAAALGVVGIDWEARQLVAVGDDRWLGILVVAFLVAPVAIAAAYAAAGRTGRVVVVGCWAAVLVLTVGLVSRYVDRSLGGSELDGALPEWAWLGVIGLLGAMGLTRDLRPALSRTKTRLDAGHANVRGPRAALPALRVFIDELVPGRDAGRNEAVESERGRLAADLHAEVLPSLRRALAQAEAGGTVERLAVDLRVAVDEVESMLLARRSIVLEEMGLLAGVEWLAERVEDRSDVRVEIAVDGGGDAEATPADRPPREAERAAFRVAQLALDNVVRHAPSSTARVSVAVGPRLIRLRVEDDADSAPIDEAAAARSGRRGIADMRAEAAACRGALEVWRGAGDRGTAIVFRWPA
jgi:signal transduction histidine kinase